MQAKLRNSAVTALLGLALAAPNCGAQNADALSRSDLISLSAGNAAQSNISIQTPTPWPDYVNDTRIPIDARLGAAAIETLMEPAKRNDSGGTSAALP